MSGEQDVSVRLRELAAIIESSYDAVIGKRLDGTITSWNRAAERMYGYSAEEMVGRSIELLEPPDRHGEIQAFLGRLAKGEQIGEVETLRLRRDGTVIPVLLTISPVEMAGEIVGAATIARDLTPRREAEDALRRWEATYRQLFEQHPEAMFVYDRTTHRFVAANGAMLDLYGWSHKELLSMSLEEIWPPEERNAIYATVEHGPVEAISRVARHLHMRKDGTVFPVTATARWIDYDGSPARLVLIEDLGDKERLEAELRQSQKMDAIGRLAGGIAHDFNNLLVVIRGNSHFLLGRLDGESHELVAQIDAAAERASTLTRQLLAFSRQRVLRPEALDLNGVVTEAVALLERSLGEDVVITAELAPSLGAIFVDRSELANAILNLAINARDAMPDGGTLEIRTAAVDVTVGEQRGEIPPGRYAFLQVTDSGIGMDETTRTQAFDPFFTTKQEGTGLGLAAVYGIVTQSGGHIWLYSEPGLGATFKLYFPLTDDAPAPSPEAQEPRAIEGTEVILVVEDAEMVRQLVELTLGFYGYRVLAVENAEEALALAGSGDEEIDLLLTDVIMPGMNGRELAERLLAVRPGLKVLFTSGYPADTILRLGIAAASTDFIEKPYLPDDLARAIRRILDRPDP